MFLKTYLQFLHMYTILHRNHVWNFQYIFQNFVCIKVTHRNYIWLAFWSLHSWNLSHLTSLFGRERYYPQIHDLHSSPLFNDCELYSSPLLQILQSFPCALMIWLFVPHSPPKLSRRIPTPWGNQITPSLSTLQSTVLRPIMTGSSDVSNFYLWFSESWSRKPSRRKFSLKQHLR